MGFCGEYVDAWVKVMIATIGLDIELYKCDFFGLDENMLTYEYGERYIDRI